MQTSPNVTPITGKIYRLHGPARHILFPGKEVDETVHLLLRRHWSLIVRNCFVLLIEAFVPVVVYVFLSVGLNIDFSAGSIMGTIAVLLGSVFYLFLWLFFLNQWIDYYLDIWIVTDKRILNVEQNGLFSRTISELHISKIQDVTSIVNGKLQTFMDFGDVHVQTAGEQERFIFEKVPRPRQVAKVIMDLHHEAERKEAHDLRSEELKAEAEAQTEQIKRNSKSLP